MTKPERICPKTGASTIEPPTEWSPHSLYGLKRCNGSDDGRLELLSVIVGWMMREREWPFKLAVDEIRNALPELYVLNYDDYAKLIPPNFSHEHTAVLVDENDRGAITNLHLYWSNDSGFYLGAPKLLSQRVLDPLAVRLSDAALLWGYCRSRPESVVEPVSTPMDGEPSEVTKSKVAPEQATSTDAAPTAPVQGLRTKDIATCFANCTFTEVNWPKRLCATGAQWLQPFNLARGKAGGASALWDPLGVAQALLARTKVKKDKEKLLKRLHARFVKMPALAPWKNKFNDYFALFADID